METWGLVISAVSGLTSLIGFVGIFVKYGRDKGTMEASLNNISERFSEVPNKSVIEATLKELRKDVDANAKDINAVGSKVNQIQLDNMQVVTALSSDLGWIKSSLTDIKTEMQKKRSRQNA